MKRILSILLLGCLFLPFFSTVAWLNYQKKVIRKSIKHQLAMGVEDDELVFFSFSLNELDSKVQWKHSKEFGYQGSMYDIVRADTVGNQVNYWCWWDHEETKLNKKLYHLLATQLQHNSKHKETKSILVHYYFGLFHESVPDWSIELIPLETNILFSYQKKLVSQEFPPETPPPSLM